MNRLLRILSIGTYVLSNLPVGPYRLEAMLQGFRAYAQTGIVLVESNTGSRVHGCMGAQVPVHRFIGSSVHGFVVHSDQGHGDTETRRFLCT
jgi:hypothetical protein